MKNKFFYLVFILSINSVSADVLHVAVAANFMKPIKILNNCMLKLNMVRLIMSS
jgi:hypothetical protein